MNNNFLSDSQKSPNNGSALRKLPRILQKSALAVTAALALSSCDDIKSGLGPNSTPDANSIERPIYTEKTAKINYVTDRGNPISPKIKNLEITLPPGDYRVTILGMNLSGSNGQDIIKGADAVFSQEYHSTGGEGPIPIKVRKFGAHQSLMIVSGENLQQTILFHADKEVTYSDSVSTNSSQTR